jgi:hypothetical protein
MTYHPKEYDEHFKGNRAIIPATLNSEIGYPFKKKATAPSDSENSASHKTIPHDSEQRIIYSSVQASENPLSNHGTVGSKYSTQINKDSKRKTWITRFTK